MSGPSLHSLWARLNYPDGKKLWHAKTANSHYSICGRADFNHPRAEFQATKPESKICELCAAKLARVA